MSKTPTQSKILYGTLAISFSLHLLFLGSMQVERNPGRQESVIEVNMQAIPETKKRERKVEKKESRKNGVTPQKEKAEKESLNSQSNFSTSMDYLKFLESQTSSMNLPLSEKTVQKDKPYTGHHKSEILVEGNEVSVNFDLPLSFRREIHSGNAFARLHYKEGDIEITYLDGLPEIRAALYEALQKSIVQIRELFSYFKTRSLKISVTFLREYAPHKREEFEKKIEVFDKKVNIKITRYLGIPRIGGGGISLPDKHAEIAKKRDEMHLRKLKESKAYKEALRKLILKEPEN